MCPVYLRKNPQRPRRVVNEVELQPILDEFGITSIDLEPLSLAEQIGLVSNAFSGPNWCWHDTYALSSARKHGDRIFAPHYINPVAVLMSDLLRHRYFMLPPIKNGEYEHRDDIEVFLWAPPRCRSGREASCIPSPPICLRKSTLKGARFTGGMYRSDANIRTFKMWRALLLK